MRQWSFIHASGHRVIWASPEVVDAIKETLARRGATINSEVLRGEAWVDNPGMCLVDRKLWRGQVDGLSFEIPVSDFHDFLRQIKQHRNDTAFNSDNDPNRTYRSIYGWHHVIAVTQAQYDAIHDAMVAESDAVQLLADEENLRFTAGIRKVNANMVKGGLNAGVVSARATLIDAHEPIDGKRWN